MLSIIATVVLTGLASLVVATYQHRLNEASTKAISVFIKNAEEIKPTVVTNDVPANPAPPTVESNSQHVGSRLYVKIPIPYPSEVISFFDGVAGLTLFLLLGWGTPNILFGNKAEVLNLWAVPYYFTLAATFLFLVYAVLKGVGLDMAAQYVYYGVIVVCGGLSIGYLFSSGMSHIIHASENKWISSWVLCCITMQYASLKIPSRPQPDIDEPEP